MEGSGRKLTIHGYGSIAYRVQTDDGSMVTIKVNNQPFVPNLKFCLIVPQQITTDEKNNGFPEHDCTEMIINDYSYILLLDKLTKTKTILHSQEMLIPVMECNIGFCFFKKFNKAVNTFVNTRDMHAFPTIRNKIQVEDDDNDLFIRNKFDSFSEAVRKEAYEKASFEHDQSKDKQDIFLDKNDKKDADEIIKAMTPKTLTQDQTKLLEIHYKTNHCVPIKEIQVMAKMGIFDSKLASFQPPVCALCMFGCSHKKPWRVKRKEKHVIRSESETAAGENTYLDAVTSSTPGIIPYMSGFLTSDRFWAATVFVDHAT